MVERSLVADNSILHDPFPQSVQELTYEHPATVESVTRVSVGPSPEREHPVSEDADEHDEGDGTAEEE
jgi:hypothetical protein